jgi:spermidine/putrescine-binding protein
MLACLFQNPMHPSLKNSGMKKVFMLLAFTMPLLLGVAVAPAQTTVKQKVDAPNHKGKVKPTSTAGEKVHNVFSKHKKHSGVKVKGKNKTTNAKTKAEVHVKG